MKYINGTNDQYAINEDGEVTSFRQKKPRIMKPQIDKSGYAGVMLKMADGRMRNVKIHRAVAEAYLEGFSSKCLVLHKNDDKLDNRLSNLYIGTHKDNAADGLVNRKSNKTTLSVEQVLGIRNELRHSSIQSIAEKYEVSKNVVKNILVGRSWQSLGPLNLTEQQYNRHFIHTKYSDKLIEEIRQAYASDESASIMSIAEKFDLPYANVRRIIRGTQTFSHLEPLGTRSNKGRGAGKIDRDKADDIIRLYNSGKMNMPQLAKAYDCCISTISRVISGKHKYEGAKTKKKPLATSHGKDLFEKDITKIRSKYISGQTPNRIASSMKLSKRVVRKALRGEFDNSESLLPSYDGKLSEFGKGTFYARGSENAHAKLTEDAVRWAKKVYETGELTKKDIAEHLGVSNPVIIYAIRGFTWGHVS